MGLKGNRSLIKFLPSLCIFHDYHIRHNDKITRPRNHLETSGSVDTHTHVIICSILVETKRANSLFSWELFPYIYIQFTYIHKGIYTFTNWYMELIWEIRNKENILLNHWNVLWSGNGGHAIWMWMHIYTYIYICWFSNKLWHQILKTMLMHLYRGSYFFWKLTNRENIDLVASHQLWS